MNQFSKAQKSQIHISCQKVRVGPGGPSTSPEAGSTDQKLLISPDVDHCWIIEDFFPSEVFLLTWPELWFLVNKQAPLAAAATLRTGKLGPTISGGSTHFKKREK